MGHTLLDAQANHIGNILSHGIKGIGEDRNRHELRLGKPAQIGPTVCLDFKYLKTIDANLLKCARIKIGLFGDEVSLLAESSHKIGVDVRKGNVKSALREKQLAECPPTCATGADDGHLSHLARPSFSR